MVFTASEPGNAQLAELTSNIVSAYVSNHVVPLAELRTLIKDVHATLSEVSVPAQPMPVQKEKPKVPVKNSVQHDGIICLEDGLKFTSLKRHLRSSHGMTPEEYRTKWDLPVDYPMVTSTYAERRSELAKTMGLGKAKKKRT